MKRRALALLLMVTAPLAGCTSLFWAGTSRYQIEPITDGGKVIGCCVLTVQSGKQYAVVDARFQKVGDDYEITLHEDDVQAFRGQAIAAGAASDTLAAGVAAIGNAAATAVKLSTGTQ